MSAQQTSDEIRITRGDISQLEDCKEALQNSELGRIYFESEAQMVDFLTRGFTADEIAVALDGAGEVYGFMLVKPKGVFGAFPYLNVIAVKEAHRGKGIGKKLMDHFETEGFKAEPMVFLLVGEFNRDAQRLYARLGYEQVGAVPNLFVKGHTELILMKRRPDAG